MKNIKDKLRNTLFVIGILGILAAGIEGIVINQKNKKINHLQEESDNSRVNYLDWIGRYTRLDSAKFVDSAKLIMKHNSEMLSFQKDYLELVSENDSLEDKCIELTKSRIEDNENILDLTFGLMQSAREIDYYKSYSKYLNSELTKLLTQKDSSYLKTP